MKLHFANRILSVSVACAVAHHANVREQTTSNTTLLSRSFLLVPAASKTRLPYVESDHLARLTFTEAGISELRTN
jgi:hypothetical protein